MHRSVSCVFLLVALAAAAGCGSDENGDTPTSPGPGTIVTDTFSGILTLNGAATYPFIVTGPGSITAQLTSLVPDPLKPVGLSLGTWNGASCQVGAGLFNDKSVQGSVVIGETQTVGDFCVRIYDAAGTAVDAVTYTIEVTHL